MIRALGENIDNKPHLWNRKTAKLKSKVTKNGNTRHEKEEEEDGHHFSSSSGRLEALPHLSALLWTTLLPSIDVGRKETDEGFTVGSWLVHIPSVVFLPSAPRPFQRPLKQQAVRLWQLASNGFYSSRAARFPDSLWSCVCVLKCLFGLCM